MSNYFPQLASVDLDAVDLHNKKTGQLEYRVEELKDMASTMGQHAAFRVSTNTMHAYIKARIADLEYDCAVILNRPTDGLRAERNSAVSDLLHTIVAGSPPLSKLEGELMMDALDAKIAALNTFLRQYALTTWRQLRVVSIVLSIGNSAFTFKITTPAL